MSQETRKKRRGSILLKSGDNPVFMSFSKNGIQIAQRIEKKEGIKLIKSNKGVYYIIEIPTNNLLKLSYLLLKKVVREHLRSKGTKEVDIGELFGESSKTSEKEEVPFE